MHNGEQHNGKGKLKYFQYLIGNLKSDSDFPKKILFYLNDSPSKMMKNAFYFILKALFVLNIFKFLS